MKVAVTGASGFIGGHVLAALAKHGDVEIIALSRREILKRDLPSNARWIRHDLAHSRPDLYASIGRPDVVIHLAWGGLPNYQSADHLQKELPIQQAFLADLIEAGLPALLVSGTCYEYGMLEGELVEGDCGPLSSVYAQAKVRLLESLHKIHEAKPFALTWARLFYTWGAGQAPTSLFPLLQRAVERGDPSFPMSKGDQVRDYLAVGEVAAIITELALSKGDAGIVNVCSGAPVTVRAQVESWLHQLGCDIRLELGAYPYPEHEPFAFWGSTRKLERVVLEE